MAKKIIVEKGNHSPLGASSAARWINCPGSIRHIEALSESDQGSTSLAAAEGTAAHLVGSTALEEKKDAWEYIGIEIVVEGMSFVVDKEMADAVQVYLDYVNNRFKQFEDDGAVLYIEHPMYSILDKDAYGTGDAVIVVPEDRIIICDYKHGRGVVVEPDSLQLQEYGYFACELYPELAGQDAAPPKVVEQVIVQPRIPHPKGLVRKHVTSPDALAEWFLTVTLPAMAETRNPDAVLKIGDWCKFCPAKRAGTCPALRGEAFEFPMEVDPTHLTSEEIGELLLKAKAIEDYLKSIRELAFKRVLDGQDIPGFKLVKKKANRIWKENTDKKLVKQFGEEAYQPRKLLTPPNVAKLKGGKTFVSKNAYTPETGLTIAPDSDKRTGVNRPMDEFMDRNNM